jgi:hypothetical protein
MVVSTALGILQQKLTFLTEVDMKPKKKTVAKRQHFYTAAQARKRQATKEAKETKDTKKKEPQREPSTLEKWINKISGRDK